MKYSAILPSLLSIAFAGSLHATLQSDIGFTELKQQFGSTLPTGDNLAVLMVEAPDSSGNWAVAKSGELSTRNITFPLATTRPTTYSAHANTVAKNLTGVTTSILPGLADLQVASVGTYRSKSIHMGTFATPEIATWDVENHSLISNVTTYNLNAIWLLDYRIARDNVTVVIALENGTNAMQPLWGNNYNTIAVGSATGQHSRGGTNLDGSGRQKPDLVGTATYTSYATPVVASAAGLLIAETKRTPSLAVAKDPRTVKALLMAGATKEEFPSWSHTTTQPLDPIYGAGQVNIYNSYVALVSGRIAAGATMDTTAGWDLGTSAKTGTSYYFSVPSGQTLKLSTALCWHRELTTTNFWVFNSSLNNLNLRLRNVSTGSIVAESASTIDNVEHLYLTAIPAGNYALEVVGDAGSTYGLAWYGSLSGGSSEPVVTEPAVASPAITAQPASLSVTEGASASFSVTATGDALTYQWCKDGTNISGATARSYSIAAANASYVGKYCVVVANSAGSVTSSEVSLAVAAATTPEQPSIDLGTLTKLTPSATTARGDNAPTERIANLVDGSAGTKWLDFAGTTWVRLELAAPTSLASYSFTAANDHYERDPYNWTVSGSNDGVNWTIVDTRSAEVFATRYLQRDFVLANASAAYRFFRFDITCRGGSITQVAELEIWGGSASSTEVPSVPQVVAPAISGQPAALSVTEGASASFSVTATGDSLSYQWRKDGTAISGATSASYSIAATTLASAGSYSVVVSNSTGSVTSSAATLSVTAAPVTEQPAIDLTALTELVPSATTARGDNAPTERIANLVDGSAGTKWLDFAGTTWVRLELAAPTSLASYSFTAANDHYERDPYNWTVSGSNDGVNWTIVDTRSAEVFATRYLQRDFVLANASAAYRFFRFDITCRGGSITQVAELEIWGGSASSTEVPSVPQVVAPAISGQPAALSVTEGASASFSVTATGDSLSYQWRKDGTAISGATSASYSIAATTLASAGSYSVVVSNSTGSVTSSAATLSVTAAPVVEQPVSNDLPLVELVPTAKSARGENAPTETLAKLFDGNTGTKWLDFAPTTWVQVELAEAHQLESYSLTSANDHYERDPYNWSVYGSNDGATWTLIETRTAETFATRYLQRDFVLASTSAAYRFFRFEITCRGGSITQLAELEIWGR